MVNYKIVSQTYVSHAKNTGLDVYHFSNDRNSMQSSLGFYLTKDTYIRRIWIFFGVGRTGG